MVQKDQVMCEELEKRKRKSLMARMGRSRHAFVAAMEEKSKRRELKDSLTKLDAEEMRTLINQTMQESEKEKEKKKMMQQEMLLENLKLQNTKALEREQARYLIKAN